MVYRTQQGMYKVLCGLLLQAEILVHAAASVDGKHDLQRQLGLALEHSDLLRVFILGEDECIPIQPRDRSAFVIGNIDEDIHQPDIDVDGRRLGKAAESKGKADDRAK